MSNCHVDVYEISNIKLYKWVVCIQAKIQIVAQLEILLYYDLVNIIK